MKRNFALEFYLINDIRRNRKTIAIAAAVKFSLTYQPFKGSIIKTLLAGTAVSMLASDYCIAVALFRIPSKGASCHAGVGVTKHLSTSRLCEKILAA